MFVFLIPLRGKSSSHNWTRVSALCERTLRSACAQTHPEFKVLLVCSDLPEMDFRHPNLEILQAEFPPVQRGNREQQMHDKIRKIEHGLIHLHSQNIQYLMKLDADDCVSCNLVKFVAEHPPHRGYVVKLGWIYKEGSPWIIHTKDFSKYCGSCLIMRLQPGDLPDGHYDWNLHPLVCKPHHKMESFYEEQGNPLQPLPFPAVVYCAGTGENWSEGGMFRLSNLRQISKRLIATRYAGRKLRYEFGIS